MRTTHWQFAVLAVCFVAFAGCKKSERPIERTGESYGVQVDWPKLDTEFASASPDVRDSVTLIKRFFRYGQFPRAMTELQKLSNTANLSDPQKKLVNDLIEQTKQASDKAPSPAQ